MRLGNVTSDDAAAVAAAWIRQFADEQNNLPDIEIIRAAAIDQLQIWRGNKRAEAGLSEAKFQELVYARKAERCRAWLVSGGSFPFAAEATARGMTNTELAQLIVGEDEALLGYNDQIEAVYVAAREAIENAASIAEIETALSNLT